MKNKFNKKGYMFTIDVTIALIVLVIGVTVLFYNFSTKDKTIYFTEQISEDMIGVMAYTDLDDLCSNTGTPTCDCPNYVELSQIVCRSSPTLRSYDVNLLGMFSEVIERGIATSDEVKAIIREMFITKNVIDERRFGFAILYTNMESTISLQLFHSEMDMP